MTPVRRTSRRIQKNQDKLQQMVHDADPVQRGKVTKPKPVKSTRARQLKDAQKITDEQKLPGRAITRSSAATITSKSTSSSGSEKNEASSSSEKIKTVKVKRAVKKENITPISSPIGSTAPTQASTPEPEVAVKTRKKVRKREKYDKEADVPMKAEVKKNITNTKGSDVVKGKIMKSEKSGGNNVEDDKKSVDNNENTTLKISTTPTSQFSRLALMDMDQLPESQKYTKTVIACKRTPSLKETFPGRLEWKKKHYDKPVHSTPVAVKTKPISSLSQERDACFGFNDSKDSEREFYDDVISPILDPVKVRRKGNGLVYQRIPATKVEKKPVVIDHQEQFENLLHRYHEDDEEDGELHVNPEGAKITYSNKHRINKYDHENMLFEKLESPVKSNKKSSKKRPTKKLAVDHIKKERKEDIVDPGLEKWLEEKNKEFQAIEKVKLVLEKSTSPIE